MTLQQGRQSAAVSTADVHYTRIAPEVMNQGRILDDFDTALDHCPMHASQTRMVGQLIEALATCRQRPARLDDLAQLAEQVPHDPGGEGGTPTHRARHSTPQQLT